MGRGNRVFTPKRTVEYETKVRTVASEHCESPFDSFVSVKIDAYLKGKRVPDIDNIAKSILDGLQPVAFDNDKQVRELDIRLISVSDKTDERAEIVITELQEVS